MNFSVQAYQQQHDHANYHKNSFKNLVNKVKRDNDNDVNPQVIMISRQETLHIEIV